MKIKIRDYDNVTVIELQGELDGDLAELLQNNVREMISRGKTHIVLDMNAVGFINSEGLEQLLLIRDNCQENNCQFRIAGLEENCAEILEITRLEKEFDCCTELTEAVKIVK